MPSLLRGPTASVWLRALPVSSLLLSTSIAGHLMGKAVRHYGGYLAHLTFGSEPETDRETPFCRGSPALGPLLRQRPPEHGAV